MPLCLCFCSSWLSKLSLHRTNSSKAVQVRKAAPTARLSEGWQATGYCKKAVKSEHRKVQHRCKLFVRWIRNCTQSRFKLYISFRWMRRVKKGDDAESPLKQENDKMLDRPVEVNKKIVQPHSQAVVKAKEATQTIQQSPTWDTTPTKKHPSRHQFKKEVQNWQKQKKDSWHTNSQTSYRCIYH